MDRKKKGIRLKGEKRTSEMERRKMESIRWKEEELKEWDKKKKKEWDRKTE